MWKTISLLFAVILQTSSVVVAQCPPEGFDAVKEFDIERFIDERWYSLRQLPVFYQPDDQLNCVFADYALGRSIFGDPGISVFNSARDGSVSGRVVSIKFKATIPDAENNPAKANIGPRFLPSFLRRGTNYWVVAVGTYNELTGVDAEDSPFYQWAIITAGAPSEDGENNRCFSSGGVWFFSREPTAPEGVPEAIEAIAIGLGLDTSVLKPVTQEGCDYDGGSRSLRGILGGIF